MSQVEDAHLREELCIKISRMSPRKLEFESRFLFTITFITAFIIGCNNTGTGVTATQTTASKIQTPTKLSTISPPPATPETIPFEFPGNIDPVKFYLFYLHGKIIEDQGIPAFSPDFGEYQYREILEALSRHGLAVISKVRPKGTEVVEYARKVSEQIETLLEAGVPANQVTVVGASKGAGIAIYISNFLKNKDINYVIMGICHPGEVRRLIEEGVFLTGNVLSIYDSADGYAGSCQELFSFSAGKGISIYDEIVLDLGAGHGVLYQPLEEWIIPAVRWANTTSP